MTRTIRDHWDDRWAVYDIRPTRHGWPVMLGRPKQDGRSLNRTGGNRVIFTTELVEHMEANRMTRLDKLGLPLGHTTIKRLRSVLGLHRQDDRREWWEQHADELASMTETEFAEKHGYALSRVSQVNRVMFGKRLREPGWWREEPAVTLLRGDQPRSVVAESLRVSAGAVGRLRWILRHEDDHT